jgi:hypothetical protein
MQSYYVGIAFLVMVLFPLFVAKRSEKHDEDLNSFGSKDV